MHEWREPTGFKPTGVKRALKLFTEGGGTTDRSSNHVIEVEKMLRILCRIKGNLKSSKHKVAKEERRISESSF